MTTTVFDFSATLKNYHAFQKWLVEVGLVPESKVCPDCEGSMRLEPGKPLWICSKRAKHPNKKIKKMSLYKNTIFEGQKSSPETIMEICWCFSLKLTYSQTAEQTKASPNSIHKWFSYFRELCMDSLNTGGMVGKIGGPGTIVEIDETKVIYCMSKK